MVELIKPLGFGDLRTQSKELGRKEREREREEMETSCKFTHQTTVGQVSMVRCDHDITAMSLT